MRFLSFLRDFLYKTEEFYPQHIKNSGGSIYDYKTMLSMEERDYPRFLKQAYYMKMGKNLNLRNPKRFSEKIQWLKLYDNLPIKTTLTLFSVVFKY